MKKPSIFATVLLAALLLFSGCTPTGQSLTQAQIDEVNQAFEPLLPIDHEKYEFILNPICHFISSTYDKPEDMDFERFTQYFSTANMLTADKVSSDEFLLLKNQGAFPFKGTDRLEDMPVPIQRKPKAEIDAVLEQYMGITSDALKTDAVPYLGEPYQSFYTYTSDAGFEQFICTGGEIKGDKVMLYSETHILTLQKSGDGYRIVSHQEK